MDLIRLLLLWQEGDGRPVDLDRYEEEQLLYHLALMVDAQLIEAYIEHDEAGAVSDARVHRLTWAGHDFLDASRSPDLWQIAKEKVMKPGASWTFGILVEWLKAEALARLGAR